MSKVCKQLIAESINPSEWEIKPPESATWKLLWVNGYIDIEKIHATYVTKTDISTSAVSKKRSNCLWAEIEGIVTSLNVTHDFTKLICFLERFKAWIAKELLEWTRLSCNKAWSLYHFKFYRAFFKQGISK